MTDRHVMLDLETFGTAPDAAIVQVGAIEFDLSLNKALGATFERTVALQSSILVGGSVDVDTIAWWRRQSYEAKLSVSSCDSGTLSDALGRFSSWFPEGAHLWSHGAAFDVPVLASAYRALGLREPWDHRRVRDTRTLFALAEELAGWEKPKRETAHTALADAVAQAEDVRAAYAALRGRVAFGEAREKRDGRTINLNDRVLVDLTAAGGRIWREQHESEPPTYVGLSLSLWEIASTFGSVLYNGNPELPFESMELRVVS